MAKNYKFGDKIFIEVGEEKILGVVTNSETIISVLDQAGKQHKVSIDKISKIK